MLDSSLKQQVETLFASLQADYVLDITVSPEHENRKALLELLEDVAGASGQITCRVKNGDRLEFSLLKNGKNTGIKFRGIPNGH